MNKKIVVLGSTGSIGTQTLEIARQQKDIEIFALCAGRNSKGLEEQIREFRPKFAALWEEKSAKDLQERVADLDVKVLSGMEGLLEIVSRPEYETLVTAIVGMLGIRPTIAAIQAGKTIALANKETLVCAGHIIMPLANGNNISILPVDSEHSAIFQSLNGEEGNKISKILLTASGGPFRGWTKEELGKVQVEQALKHPNWTMGSKITIDSATMVNKGLEVMEAKWLFQVATEQIQVVIHPQSIIHSMVEFEDGGIMAQLGTPDMRLPIQYALYYPHRRSLPGKRLDFYELGNISFEKPDFTVFTGLKLAYVAMEGGGNLPTAYNAANEKAVELFLNRKISFLKISELIQGCMENSDFRENPTLEEILETEQMCHEWIDRNR